LALLVSFTASGIDGKKFQDLSKQESLTEQQFLDETGSVNGAYVIFLQKDTPSNAVIQDVLDAKIKRDEKLSELQASIQLLHDEIKTQLPSSNQLKMIESYRQVLHMLDIHQQQGDAVIELMEYAKSVDYTKLTDEQQTKISQLKKKVDGYNDDLTKAQFELQNSNLSVN
jgi:phosphoglycerate-specific signal transduction histidine kinase